MDAEQLERHRFFLKETIRKQVDWSRTAQSRGVAPPLLQKAVDASAARIDLAPIEELGDVTDVRLVDAIVHRSSRRDYSDDPLTMRELSFLLWATQGLRRPVRGVSSFRSVPSAGSRHAFETYLYVRRVEGLEEAIYRYLPLEHKLTVHQAVSGMGAVFADACFGQGFVAKAAVFFMWSVIPYRAEWRYDLAAHKTIAIDAGHVCQNLYLACEGIGAGTCAIGAYDQERMDGLLGLDGDDEFTVYVAPVGKR